MPKITRHGGASIAGEHGPETAPVVDGEEQPAQDGDAAPEESASVPEETPAPPARKRQQRRKT
ncbi:hypothetical protein [Streptomyces sp. ECR3.8]|uniref:hypothetical protein n=1 Tax=Streptomyces sp. ECR3.8 TaxID=3461009 RepID=UPI004042C837